MYIVKRRWCGAWIRGQGGRERSEQRGKREGRKLTRKRAHAAAMTTAKDDTGTSAWRHTHFAGPHKAQEHQHRSVSVGPAASGTRHKV